MATEPVEKDGFKYEIKKAIPEECKHCKTYKIFESKLDRLSDRVNMMNEVLALDNISFLKSEIGRGFREGYGRILLDNIVDGVIIFEEDAKIQAFNSVAEEIFFYPAEEAQMECINTLIPKLSPASYVQFVKNKNDKSQTFGKDVAGINKNGLSISLDLQVNKIDFNGYFLFMVVIQKPDVRQKFL